MSEAIIGAWPGSSWIHWARALTAGLIATVVMTVVMALMHMNIVKMLGGMIVGSSAAIATQYAAGGAMHLMIGLVYGVIYAALVGWVLEWNRVIKGAIYGLAIAAIALAVMPIMSAMMTGGGSTKAPAPAKHASAMNACAKNPCQAKAAANPCNPCGGQNAGPWSGALSVVNHLAYALTLAFVYGKATQ